MQFEEYAIKLNAGDFACRSKAKAKPQKRDSASSSTRTTPIGEMTSTDLEPEKYSSIAYPVSKKLINLLRHSSLPRDNDGAIEFWRMKDHVQTHFLYCHLCLTKSGGAAWQEEEDKRKDFSIVLILQEQFYTSKLFKVIQDAILLILFCRTMLLFRTVSSSTFIMWDVQTIYIPSSIQD